METLKIAVIYGSVRTERQGIKAAKFMVNKLKEKNHQPFLIDPKEFDLPFLKKTYAKYEKDEIPEKLKKLAEIIKSMDAYIIVSAEYNHGVPAPLKNLLDYFFTEYFFKPSAIVTYSAGSFGGARVAMQWRAILPEMGMSSIPSLFAIPKIGEAFDEDGNAKNDVYDNRVEKFLKELEWYALALKFQREKGVPY